MPEQVARRRCRSWLACRNAIFRNEKISYKVREHSVMKVPFILAVGGREAEAGTLHCADLDQMNSWYWIWPKPGDVDSDESLAPDMVAKP
jgi:threonyl-tRNA synthetase